MPAHHTPPPERRKAAVYRRVSSTAQSEDGRHSLEVQQEVGRRFAEIYQMDVVWDDYDDTTSRHGIDYLPKLDFLINQMAEDGDIDVIVIDKLDRLTRAGQGDYWDAVNKLTKAEVRLFAVTDDFDSFNRHDRLRGDLGAMSAEQENTNRTINVVRGRHQRVIKDHMPLPGPAEPYGWEWIDPYPTGPKQPVKTKLRHNPTEAPFVQWLYDHLDAGGTLSTAAQYLNERHAPRRTPGAGWTAGHVRAVVMNPAQWGTYYAFRYVTADWTPKEKREYRKAHGGRKAKKPRHCYDLLYGSEEDKRKADAVLALRYPAGDAPRLVPMPGVLVDLPLVDEPKAQRVLATLKDNQAHAATNVRRYTPDDALFTGQQVKCAYCQRALRIRRRSESADKRGHRRLVRPWQYVCARGVNNAYPCRAGGVSIPCARLDAFAWGMVCRAIRDEDFLRRLIAKTDELTRATARADSYRQQIADLKAEQARWLKKIGLLDPDDPHYKEDEAAYRQERHNLDPQIKHAEEQLAHAEDEARQLEQRHRVLTEFHQYATEQREHLDDLTAAQRAGILRHLRVQLLVGAEHLTKRKWLFQQEDWQGNGSWYYPDRIAMTINLTNNPEAAKLIAREWRRYAAYDPAADDDTNHNTWFAVLDGKPDFPDFQPSGEYEFDEPYFDIHEQPWPPVAPLAPAPKDCAAHTQQHDDEEGRPDHTARQQ